MGVRAPASISNINDLRWNIKGIKAKVVNSIKGDQLGRKEMDWMLAEVVIELIEIIEQMVKDGKI